MQTVIVFIIIALSILFLLVYLVKKAKGEEYNCGKSGKYDNGCSDNCTECPLKKKKKKKKK